MKRTLDQLVASFNELEEAKREVEVRKVLEEKIRPHVLNLDNWRIDDLNKIQCAPILIDKPEGMGERYQCYNLAWDRMARELVNNGDDAYSVSYSGSSWDIHPNISYRPRSDKQRRKKKAAKEASAETIYKKTWERHGSDFVDVVRGEAERIGAFLSNADNWVAETRLSKPFAWTDRLKYTRYDSYAEVKRLVCLQLDTEDLTLTFRDVEFHEKVAAKIVGKRNPSLNDNSDDDI
jgi:hypothetical protein